MTGTISFFFSQVFSQSGYPTHSTRYLSVLPSRHFSTSLSTVHRLSSGSRAGGRSYSGLSSVSSSGLSSTWRPKINARPSPAVGGAHKVLWLSFSVSASTEIFGTSSSPYRALAPMAGISTFRSLAVASSSIYLVRHGKHGR